MPSRVGVLIPTLNAAGTITAAIASAWRAKADQVWISDGGSSDGTPELAVRAGAKVIAESSVRGSQSNAAAHHCDCESLIFLHGDTTLPENGCSLVRNALEGGFEFGGFRLRFRERQLRLLVAERMINLRTRFTLCPWGDQAQFIRRDAFLALGGYRSIPIMEDYDLAVRMKQRGRNVLLSEHVITSGARFLRKGLLVTMATNWRIVIAYRSGVEPEKLASIYNR